MASDPMSRHSLGARRYRASLPARKIARQASQPDALHSVKTPQGYHHLSGLLESR